MLQSTDNRASSTAARIAVALIEWEATERLVSELNGHVDRQRQLVEQLARQGHEIISAATVLDSLIASLSLADDHRYRLAAMLDTKSDESSPTLKSNTLRVIQGRSEDRQNAAADTIHT